MHSCSLTLVLLLLLATPLLAQSPVNLVGDPGFRLDSTTTWKTSHGSPDYHRTGAGCQDTGFVALWGNRDKGEGIYQQLALPLRRRREYKVSICLRQDTATPARPRYVRVRLLALQAPQVTGGSHPQEDTPSVITLWSVTTSAAEWTTFTLPKWIAPADYDYIAINAENDNPDTLDPLNVSWAHIDNLVIEDITPPAPVDTLCSTNILANPRFAGITRTEDLTDGLIGGWSSAYGSPTAGAGIGCPDAGYIALWGDRRNGEAIVQRLTSKRIRTGNVYSFALCFRNDTNTTARPRYVRIRVLALKSLPGANGSHWSANDSTIVQIGEFETDKPYWVGARLPDWVAPDDFEYIAINAQNDETPGSAANSSWAQIDNVQLCLVSEPNPDPCAMNIVGNPTFTGATAQGVFMKGVMPSWEPAYGTSQNYTGNGCPDPGYLFLRGNRDIGSGIVQRLTTPIEPGSQYLLTLCARRHATAQGPTYVRLRFVAAKELPQSNDDRHWMVDGTNIVEVGTMTITDQSWKELSLPVWTAPAGYDYLAINVENNEADDGTTISHSYAAIDNVRLCPLTSNPATVKLQERIALIREEIVPNPISGIGRICFTVPQRQHLRLNVLASDGSEIATLVDGTIDAGRHEVEWDTKGLPEGTYFIGWETGLRSQVRTVIVVR